jgi:transcriptional repressor NrdR
MDCPFCQTPDTKVTDSRYVPESNQIRRRRECVKCAERFTTYEMAELNMPRVIKKEGSRVAFDEQRLRAGILRATEKRPVTAEQIDTAMSRIFKKIRATGEKEMMSSEIGEYVMEELRELDDVAYVRFASVYRQFQDLDAFMDEIKKLAKGRIRQKS